MPGESAARPGFRERGGAWVVAQSGLMLLILALGPLLPGVASAGWHAPLAALLAVLGAGFGIGGAWVLGRNRTIFPLPNAGSELIEHGIFRVVRHPLYTSLTLLAAAWAVGWASWSAALAGLVQTVFLDLKSRREEVWLRARFPGYADYARRVRRFLPGIY
jgi:protein-S-isoprenylcysteine O-methyltransferase Ste14